MQYASFLSNKLDRWHMHLTAWNLFTSLTWTQLCSKHLLHVTPCNLRKMETRLSKIPHTNPFMLPNLFSRKFAFCLFRNYANIYAHGCMHRMTFQNSSCLGYHHLVWNGENKTYKMKRTVLFQDNTHPQRRGGGGGTPDFKTQGCSNGCKNQNPKKSLDQI